MRLTFNFSHPDPDINMLKSTNNVYVQGYPKQRCQNDMAKQVYTKRIEKKKVHIGT